MKIVVSDSTPLISLMKAGMLVVLDGLFGEVLIPEAVFQEVTTNEEFKDEANLVREGLISEKEVEEAFDKIRKSHRHISEQLIRDALDAIHGK